MIIGESSDAAETSTGRDDEVSRYIEVCPRCQQSFDTRVLHQVIYHDQPEHKPIETNV
jgi:hypothetical protein